VTRARRRASRNQPSWRSYSPPEPEPLLSPAGSSTGSGVGAASSRSPPSEPDPAPAPVCALFVAGVNWRVAQVVPPSVLRANRTGSLPAVPRKPTLHTYTFPKAWAPGGKVWLGSHPDDYLLDLYAERPAFLVVDSKSAGVYDTVYADLDNDHRFGDEKPITKSSPASYRDMDGDGYTDLSGGLLYFISDGETTIPGGATFFGDDDTPAPGALLAWTGDYDPGIEGHGTLTASNVVGQAVINGNAPRFSDLRTKDGRVPGAVAPGAPARPCGRRLGVLPPRRLGAGGGRGLTGPARLGRRPPGGQRQPQPVPDLGQAGAPWDHHQPVIAADPVLQQAALC